MADTGWAPSDDEWGAHDRDWRRLARQLQNGECTPFIGAGASAGVMPTAERLSQEIAERFDYPFPDGHEFQHVSQYATIRSFSAAAFKEDLAAEFGELDPPNGVGPENPYAMLARLPLSTYITTNYDAFIVRALLKAGKSPIHEHYPWYEARMPRSGRAHRPTVERPLVYHLHGNFGNSHSMVCSEEDYHVFLANLARRKDPRWKLPIPIVGAITQRPLLFVGYSLRDWTFRIIFHALLMPRAEMLKHAHVSIQLAPRLTDGRPETLARAKDYLERYYGQFKISVYWGGTDLFFQTLAGYLDSSA